MPMTSGDTNKQKFLLRVVNTRGDRRRRSPRVFTIRNGMLFLIRKYSACTHMHAIHSCTQSSAMRL